MDEPRFKGDDVCLIDLNIEEEQSNPERSVSNGEIYFKQETFKNKCSINTMFRIFSDVLQKNYLNESVCHEIYLSLCQFIKNYEFDRFLFKYFKNSLISISVIEEVCFTDLQNKWGCIANKGGGFSNIEGNIFSDYNAESGYGKNSDLTIKLIFNLIVIIVLQEKSHSVSLHMSIKILSLYENILKKEFQGEQVNTILITKFGYSTIYKYFKNNLAGNQEINHKEALFLSEIINSEKIVISKFQGWFHLLINFAKNKVYDKNFIECTKVLNILLKTTNGFLDDFFAPLLTFYAEYCIKPNNFVCMNLKDLNILKETIEILIGKMNNEKYENLVYNLYNNFLNNITLLSGGTDQSLLMKEEIYCFCTNLFIVYKLYQNISNLGLRGLTVHESLFGFNNDMIYQRNIHVKTLNVDDNVKTFHENNIFVENLSKNEQIYLSNMYFISKYEYMMLFLKTERLIEKYELKNSIKHTFKYDLFTNGRFITDFGFLNTLKGIFSKETDYINLLNKENFMLANPMLMLNSVDTVNSSYIHYLYMENNITEIYFTSLSVINNYKKTGKVKNKAFLLLCPENYNTKLDNKRVVVNRHILINELLNIPTLDYKNIEILHNIIESNINKGVIDKLLISHILTLPVNEETSIIFKFLIVKLNEEISYLSKDFPLSSICGNEDISNPTTYKYLLFLLSLVLDKYGKIDCDMKFYHYTYIAVLFNRSYTKDSFDKKILVDILKHSLVCSDYQRNEINCIMETNCMTCLKMYKVLSHIKDILEIT